MTEIEFQIIAENSTDDPLLDADELDLLLDSTRAQIRQHIQQRVGAYVCEEHGRAAKIIVRGTYAPDTEQLDISYNVEACCNLMTMRVATMLSRM